MSSMAIREVPQIFIQIFPANLFKRNYITIRKMMRIFPLNLFDTVPLIFYFKFFLEFLNRQGKEIIEWAERGPGWICLNKDSLRPE